MTWFGEAGVEPKRRQKPMLRVKMKVLAGIILGGLAGYYAGALIGCKWVWPESNLCGFLGVFVTGPIGAIAGGVWGYVAQRRGRNPNRRG